MQHLADELLKPRMVEVSELSQNRYRIVLEPLERGFGHTLGSALRRILLSSLTGAAVVEAEIENVLHEYSAIEGVKESVMKKLGNERFVANAKPEVVDAERKKKADAESKIASLKEGIEGLKK